MKFAALASLLLLAPGAFALEWKTQQLSIKASPLDKHAETTFEFTNTGDKPVTIRSVDTSCDCTEATPSSRTFAPGASGRIDVRFTLGDRFGTYQRMIIVSTDDGEKPAALSVELTVPEIATLSPRSVEWKLHGPRDEQAVEVTVTEGLELSINNVQSTSEAFTYRLETIEAGKHYRLHLAPKATDVAANAAFRLLAKAGNGRDLIFSAYANVR